MDQVAGKAGGAHPTGSTLAVSVTVPGLEKLVTVAALVEGVTVNDVHPVAGTPTSVSPASVVANPGGGVTAPGLSTVSSHEGSHGLLAHGPGEPSPERGRARSPRAAVGLDTTMTLSHAPHAVPSQVDFPSAQLT